MLHTIVVVDDDEGFRQLLFAVLDSAEYSLRFFGTAAEAESYLETGSASVIISDVILPDDDGRALVRRLRARPFLRDVPVIFSTGLTPIDLRQLQEEAQALNARILFKPFDVTQLVNTVSRAINERRAEAL